MSHPYQSIFRDDLYQDKVFIVTGGGSGIGRCTAHELASLGAHVILIGRTQEKLDAVAAEIVEDGGSAEGFSCDIREEDIVKASVKEIVKKHPIISGLVNNAGGQFPAPLTGINQKGWETVVRTNLTGGFLMAKEVYLQSMSKHGGSIVNIVADMWGGMPGMGHSGAARAGMVNFTQTAAVEWAAAGVRVNAVAPGFIETDMVTDLDPSMFEHTLNNASIGSMGTPEDVANVVHSLLTPGYIQATTIKVDGGHLR